MPMGNPYVYVYTINQRRVQHVCTHGGMWCLEPLQVVPPNSLAYALCPNQEFGMNHAVWELWDPTEAEEGKRGGP